MQFIIADDFFINQFLVIIISCYDHPDKCSYHEEGHDIVCLLVSFSITKIQQLFETTKFILTFLDFFLVVGRGRRIIVL